MRVVIVLALLCATASAENRWHAGLNLRADLGTHPIRTGVGIETGRLDTTLVLDPMFWTDGQVDTDLYATWRPCPRGWGVVGGWRTSAIGILGGTQFHEKLVTGVVAPLPRLGRLRALWSFELATVIVKHGGGLPTDFISFASGRDFIDLVNFGMWITLEYDRAL